ncbi:MAG: hypothetical protein JW869_01420 [Candidatus Omnitrophica bacterium]|nr:hypothetical protein [Candidatus Omnitrophota bacterium]
MSQNSAILKTRFNILKNTLTLLPKEPILKDAFVGFFVTFLLAGGFFLFWKALEFFDNLGGVGIIVVNRLFYLYFMGLFFMLVFSNIIISYATIYRSPEVKFFLKHPLTYSKIFMVKFLESMGLSSWAFFFILGPFLLAFGIHGNLGLDFYLASIMFFLPLIVLAAIIGTAVMMLLLKIIPNKRTLIAILVGITIAAIFAIIRVDVVRPPALDETSFFLRRLLPYTNLSNSLFLPNFWVAEGITAVIQGRYEQALFWWLLLFSNVCMGILVIHSLARRIYYPVWEKIQSPSATKIYSKSSIDSMVNRFKFISPDSRAMVIKDIKLFSRDAVQWSQFLIFFGILAIYFGNLQSYSYHLYSPMWKSLISFLNIFATALVLASLGARFVFPQLSLEGRSFWVLGLAPVSFKKILLQKFWLSLFFSLFISVGLICLSNHMLEVSKTIWVVSLSLIILSCISSVGLSCGLGAVFADFTVKNPAAIFSGFGGTLNFALNLIYLLLTVGVVGGVFHFNALGRIAGIVILKKYLVLCALGVVILSAICCVVPLYLGMRALREKEY